MRNLIDTAPLERLAPGGFYVALRVGFAFPLLELNELPEPWVEYYTAQRFMLFDPVIRWVYSQTGTARWSEIGDVDPRGVMRKAADFGLKYGAAVSHYVDDGDAQRSFGSFVRTDREFTDAEMEELSTCLALWHVQTRPPQNLTEAELEALRMVRSGLRVKQIAHELGVSEGAVKQRLKNAKGKLGAQTGTEAAATAQGFGLL